MGPAERGRALVIRGLVGPRVSIVVSVVAVAALSLTVIMAARRGGDVPAPGRSDDDVIEVGLVRGQPVSAYLEASRRELTALTDPSASPAGATWALVSLSDYVPPGRLPVLLAGGAVAQVYARVPLPAGHTQVLRIPVYRLPEDVTAGMVGAAQQSDQDQAEYRRLGARVSGEGPNEQRARRAYAVAAATAAAEAAAYRSDCACVFAAVVRAVPAGLREIADRPGVRVVDPAPEVRSLDDTEFRAPLPEQSGLAPDEPAPTPAPVPTGPPGIASPTVAPILSSLGHAVTSNSSRGSSPAAPDPSATALQERAAIPSASDASAAQATPSTAPPAS